MRLPECIWSGVLFAHLAVASNSFGEVRLASQAFQTAGIKVTVTSLAARERKATVALSVENTTMDNLFLAIIGPPLGTSGTAAFSPEAIGGIAWCIYNPRNVSVLGLDRNEQINGCLKADKPQLPLDTFTLIEAGNAAPMTVAFTSLNPVEPEKDFSFSMTVAVFKEADLEPSDAGSGKTKSLPRSLRYLSVGIAPIPLNQK